jgi:hypothetical protein
MENIMTTVANINAGTHGVMTLDEIKRSIEGEFLPYMHGASRMVDAKNAAKTANNAEIAGREGAMVNLAALSHKFAWSPGMIEEAMGAVVDAYAGTLDADTLKARKSSIATFKKDAALVCRAKVRADVSRIFGLAHDIFDAKDDGTDTCKKAFARAYQCAIAVFVQMKAGRAFDDAHDVIQLASEVLVARRYDGESVKRKFETIVESVREFNREFPSEYLAQCIEALCQLDADDFADLARAKLAAKLAPATAPRPLNLVHEDVPTPVVAPVPVIAPVPAFVPVPDIDAQLADVLGNAD